MSRSSCKCVGLCPTSDSAVPGQSMRYLSTKLDLALSLESTPPPFEPAPVAGFIFLGHDFLHPGAADTGAGRSKGWGNRSRPVQLKNCTGFVFSGHDLASRRCRCFNDCTRHRHDSACGCAPRTSCKRQPGNGRWKVSRSSRYWWSTVSLGSVPLPGRCCRPWVCSRSWPPVTDARRWTCCTCASSTWCCATSPCRGWTARR